MENVEISSVNGCEDMIFRIYKCYKDTENGLIMKGLPWKNSCDILSEKRNLQIMDYFISILENYILVYKHRKKH